LQDKIISIGKELRERGEFLKSRRSKLNEEHTEILTEMDRHVMIHPDNRKELGDKLLYECMDFVNIGGIMLAMVDEELPLNIMLQRLLVHHPLYGTKPRAEYTIGGEYERCRLFDMWENELCHIDRESSKLIKKGKYIWEKKVEDTMRSWRNEFRQLDEHLLYLPNSWDKYIDHSKNNKIKNPIFYIKTTLGDSINYSPITLGLFGYDTHLPFKEMHNKLIQRDSRYGTGAKK